MKSIRPPFVFHDLLQHVDMNNSYLCGYLKIKGLTEEFPMLTTFFDGEIISARYPFLTRKWDADEDVDRKHWVGEAMLLTDIVNSICHSGAPLVFTVLRLLHLHS